jgi:hypothetical protein
MMTNEKRGANPITKLTLVTINGRPVLVNAPVVDGKVRVDLQSLAAMLGIPRGSCIGAY